MKLSEKLEVCPDCKGSGEEECCGGHMCRGTKECYRCNGKGKILNKSLRELKDMLELIEEYR